MVAVCASGQSSFLSFLLRTGKRIAKKKIGKRVDVTPCEGSGTPKKYICPDAKSRNYLSELLII